MHAGITVMSLFRQDKWLSKMRGSYKVRLRTLLRRLQHDSIGDMNWIPFAVGRTNRPRKNTKFPPADRLPPAGVLQLSGSVGPCGPPAAGRFPRSERHWVDIGGRPTTRLREAADATGADGAAFGAAAATQLTRRRPPQQRWALRQSGTPATTATCAGVAIAAAAVAAVPAAGAAGRGVAPGTGGAAAAAGTRGYGRRPRLHRRCRWQTPTLRLAVSPLAALPAHHLTLQCRGRS